MNAPISYFDTDQAPAAAPDALRAELIAAGVIAPDSEARQAAARRARYVAAPGLFELDDAGRVAAQRHIREGDFGRRACRVSFDFIDPVRGRRR